MDTPLSASYFRKTCVALAVAGQKERARRLLDSFGDTAVAGNLSLLWEATELSPTTLEGTLRLWKIFYTDDLPRLNFDQWPHSTLISEVSNVENVAQLSRVIEAIGELVALDEHYPAYVGVLDRLPPSTLSSLGAEMLTADTTNFDELDEIVILARIARRLLKQAASAASPTVPELIAEIRARLARCKESARFGGGPYARLLGRYPSPLFTYAFGTLALSSALMDTAYDQDSNDLMKEGLSSLYHELRNMDRWFGDQYSFVIPLKQILELLPGDNQVQETIALVKKLEDDWKVA